MLGHITVCSVGHRNEVIASISSYLQQQVQSIAALLQPAQQAVAHPSTSRYPSKIHPSTCMHDLTKLNLGGFRGANLNKKMQTTYVLN